jgi:hypothetical protein
MEDRAPCQGWAGNYSMQEASPAHRVSAQSRVVT